MIPVYLQTPSGAAVQRLTAHTGTVTRNLGQIGTLEMTCDVPLEIGEDYRIFIDHPNESNALWLVVAYEEVLVGDQYLLQIRAEDGKRLYDKRIVWAFNDTPEGYKINYPQVVVKEVINENMVTATRTERIVPDMVAAAFPNTSSSWSAWEGEVAWQTVWDVIQKMLEFGRATNNPFAVDLFVESGGGNRLLPIISRRLGVERTFTSQQLSRYGISVRAATDASRAVTRCIALGEGERSLALTSPYPAVIYLTSSSNPFYYDESIVTLGNEDDMQALEQAAVSELARSAKKTSLVLEGAAPVQDFWGSVLSYGDRMLINHNGSEYDMTVVGYSLQWSGAGEPYVSLVCSEGY